MRTVTLGSGAAAAVSLLLLLLPLNSEAKSYPLLKDASQLSMASASASEFAWLGVGCGRGRRPPGVGWGSARGIPRHPARHPAARHIYARRPATCSQVAAWDSGAATTVTGAT